MEKLINDERLQADLVSVAIVAAILGVAVSTVYKLIQLKKLEAIDVSPTSERPSYRVSSESVKRFIHERQTIS